MIIKPGVSVTGLRPEMILALMAAQRVYADLGASVILTSALEGKHGYGSLHFAGLAVDIRIKNLRAGEAKIAASNIKEALGAQYDTVLEKNHIHIEFQPKR